MVHTIQFFIKWHILNLNMITTAIINNSSTHIYVIGIWKMFYCHHCYSTWCSLALLPAAAVLFWNNYWEENCQALLVENKRLQYYVKRTNDLKQTLSRLVQLFNINEWNRCFRIHWYENLTDIYFFIEVFWLWIVNDLKTYSMALLQHKAFLQ